MSGTPAPRPLHPPPAGSGLVPGRTTSWGSQVAPLDAASPRDSRTWKQAEYFRVGPEWGCRAPKRATGGEIESESRCRLPSERDEHGGKRLGSYTPAGAPASLPEAARPRLVLGETLSRLLCPRGAAHSSGEPAGDLTQRRRQRHLAAHTSHTPSGAEQSLCHRARGD